MYSHSLMSHFGSAAQETSVKRKYALTAEEERGWCLYIEICLRLGSSKGFKFSGMNFMLNSFTMTVPMPQTLVIEEVYLSSVD
jgi:hypothetical protein